MKKMIFTLIAFVFSMAAFAQKVLPEIKSGSVIQASVFVQGQEYPLLLAVKGINDDISLDWVVDAYGEGTFKMSAKALESGSKLLMTTQPGLGETKLADDETFGLISKTAFKSLNGTKSFTYSGLKFKLKTPSSTAVKINGKEADAINVVSEDGKFELWILNNPNFPFIIYSSGLTPDIIISEIR